MAFNSQLRTGTDCLIKIISPRTLDADNKHNFFCIQIIALVENRDCCHNLSTVDWAISGSSQRLKNGHFNSAKHEN